jgi:hypothetical protein
VKGFLITVLTAALVVGLFYVLGQAQGEVGASGAPGAAPGHVPLASEAPSLRDQLLRSTAAQNGVEPVRGVWGVLMERGYAKGVATVVALGDGTASLWLSNGGSVTGGKGYAPAHDAAQRLCALAADSLGATASVSEFPRPGAGRVRFYVLTAEGVRAVEGDLVPRAPDGGGADALAPLVAAGDAVLDALKDATNKGLLR